MWYYYNYLESFNFINIKNNSKLVNPFLCSRYGWKYKNENILLCEMYL